MPKLSAPDWIQAISSMVLVFGLLLVLYELKQARDIAQAQLASENAFIQIGIESAVMGEDAADVLARACDHPDELTKAEAEVMTAWLRIQYSRAIRSFETANLGISAGSDPTGLAQATATLFLGTEYGRHDWETLRDLGWGSQFPELAETFNQVYEEMSKNPPGWCAWGQDHSTYLQRFSEQH